MRQHRTIVIFVTLFLSTLLTVQASFSAPSCIEIFENPNLSALEWGPHFDFDLADRTLKTQKNFSKIIPMREYLESIGKKPSGTSEVYFVEFYGLKAVWKPDADLHGPAAEEATYRIARRMGINTFTPTVVTEIDGRRGSLSLYIDTPVDLVNMKGVDRVEFLKHVPKKQWADMDLVHYLLGQWDRHAGNLLIDAKYNLIVIDNEGIAQLSVWRLGTSPFTRATTVPKEDRTGLDVANKTPFPYDKIQYLDGNDSVAVSEFLTHYKIKPERLTAKEFDKFEGRKLPYVIWRDNLWRQRRAQSIAPINLSTISAQTLSALESLSTTEFREFLNPEVFTDAHIEFIMQRRNDILLRAQSAEIIP